MPPIISVEHLGKQYFLGGRKQHNSFRDLFSESVSSLFGKSVRKQSTAFWALDDISFDVQEGEVLGIIGRNGAGKSTILKVLSRITEPTKGRAVLRGRVASLLEVGTGFNRELTGRENIFLNGAILGMKKSEIKKKFDEIAAFAEIEKFIDTPVKRYSSGMYMRLAFSVAAHLEPEILIVDEVLAVGDAEFQKKCLGKMESVGKEGRTVIFVSHHMPSILQLCSHALLLEQGRIKTAGIVKDVVSQYLDHAPRVLKRRFQIDSAKPSIAFVEIDQEKLLRAELNMKIGFKSPFEIFPSVGIVVFNSLAVPIFGTNPTVQPNNCVFNKMKEGEVNLKIEHLPLQSGDYSISVWLGNGKEDFDFKEETIGFQFIRNDWPVPYSPNIIGSTFVTPIWNFSTHEVTE